MVFRNNDRSQNTFVYQPIFDTLEFKKEKFSDYVLCWKSNGVSTSIPKPLYTHFLQNIKRSGYKMRIKFHEDHLTVEQNNSLTKIENVHTAYDLAAWSRDPTNSFKFTNYLFGATSIIKSSNKDNRVFSGYWRRFLNAGEWSFDYRTARNIITFGIYSSSSSHSNNFKNICLN